MKEILNYVLYIGLMTVLLAFSACQKEKHVVLQEENDESISASSATINLLARTTSNDGSWDNIIDKSSCFDVNFPYTVVVNGMELIITSAADLQEVEETFDADDADEDILEIKYPVTITTGDFSELVISSAKELQVASDKCIEGGDDDNIECIDIVYPMTIYTFDAANNLLDDYLFMDDYEIRRFIAGIKESDRLSIKFPVTFTMYTGTELATNSLDELDSAITSATDICDEDDDDDYNDDDFAEDELNELLTACPWAIKAFEKDSENQIEQYKNYALVFTTDGIVQAIDKAGNVLVGEWATNIVDYDLQVSLYFSELTDLNKDWSVYQIKKGTIKFYTANYCKVVLETDCNLEIPVTNPLSEALLKCEWVINTLKNDGVENKNIFGNKFVFDKNGSVRLSNGESNTVGTWKVVVDANGIVYLELVMTNEPSVMYNWPLKNTETSRLHFENSSNANVLVLEKVCDDNTDDAEVVEVRNTMLSSRWFISNYTYGTQDMTDNYARYFHAFLESNRLRVTQGQTTEVNTGLWRVIRESDGYVKLYLNYDAQSELVELTGNWEVYSHSDYEINLVSKTEDGTVRQLIFQK